MKKIHILTICFIGFFLFTACDDFLNLKPRDKKVATTIEDYRDIMANYMHFLKDPVRSQEAILGVGVFTFPRFDVAKNLAVYTGEVNLTKTMLFYNTEKNEYNESGKTLLTWLNTEPYVWNQYYEFLGPINHVISAITTADGDNEELRNYVKGEALVWRAFAYYKLLQYYSPYKDNAYGLPMYLDPVDDIGNAMPTRKTQKEVFAQILKDCREVLSLLEVTSTNDWNCAYRYDFVNAMMASVYMWKAMSGAAEDTDWDNAEKCASEAMTGRQLVRTSQELRRLFDCREVTTETSLESDEFYFRIINGASQYIFNFSAAYYENPQYGLGVADGLVNQQYYRRFLDNDIRKSIYFTADGTKSDKYNLLGLSGFTGGTGGGCLMLFRLAEMYLIKAEALVRQGNVGGAQEVLRQFKNARYTGEVNIPADKDALLTEILEERTREFYMENDFRWLDMKRTGISYERTVRGENYKLQPDDFRYSFPIPRSEMELNRNMVQNPGWENIILD